MKTIRVGTFETNSSSTHSITMCMEEEYKKWENGELYYIPYNNEFVGKETRDRILRERVLYEKIDVDNRNNTLNYNGKTIGFDGWKDKLEKIKEFYTEENLSEVTQEEIDEYLENEDDTLSLPLTCEEYDDYIGERFEMFNEELETPKGEKVVSFGYYGNDW